MSLLVTAALALSFLSDPNDLDRDTIPDAIEQQLLDKFAPAFMVSMDDCDGLPAEFKKGLEEPRLVSKNGTLYGQVFKRGSLVEIHYYHLWSRDCGAVSSHDRDPEHVSVLLSPDARALYWYAAAHEGTVCDASSGGRASNLEAEGRGARIWISRGKHASFLTEERCRLGCGVDRCTRMVELKPPVIVNLGEPGAPLNGASWIASKKWNLAARMKTDFDDKVIEKIDRHDDRAETAVNGAVPTVKAILLGGNSTLAAAGTGNRHGLNALVTGGSQGLKGAGIGLKKAGSALGRIFLAGH